MSNIYTEYYCRGRGIIAETAWAHIIPLLEICVKKITGHLLFHVAYMEKYFSNNCKQILSSLSSFTW